ncbi:MAG: hypothetical protein ABH829_02295 [archaeon]
MRSNMWQLDLSNKISGRTWWWWFWILFIHNKRQPSRPDQLMVLWSTRDVDSIKVNDMPITIDRSAQTPSKFHGAVAAWNCMGGKMANDFILEECDLEIRGKALSCSTKNDYSFAETKNGFSANLAKTGLPHSFSMEYEPGLPLVESSYYPIGKYGFDIHAVERMKLSGKRAGKKISGTAYFQRVTVNAPAIPWYWGVNHFENGSVLLYNSPHMGVDLMASIQKKFHPLRHGILALPGHVSLFDPDSKSWSKYGNVKVAYSKNGMGLPVWEVYANRRGNRIRFTVDSYAHAYWKFQLPQTFGGLFYYNEYPVEVADFKLTGEKELSLSDLGYGYGNSEHSVGLLL